MPRQSIVPFIIRQPPRIGTIFRTNRQTALGIHHPLAAAPGLPALGLRGNLEVPLVWSRDLIGHRGNSRAQACRQRKRHDAPERTGGAALADLLIIPPITRNALDSLSPHLT